MSLQRQRALEWVKTKLRESTGIDAAQKRALITKASFDFDLSPAEEACLTDNLKADLKPAENPKTD
ncbi:MAG: hypothetical protein Q7K44_00135 [Candidatus Liptonbacteria bacterium]|nr:hypothetical protein [Candidatus Liptonbacteria bacterium]